jgi:SAM-dependent methyltransferase
VLNVDWSVYFRLKKNSFLRMMAAPFLRGERLRRLQSLPANIFFHNLAQRLPFASDSVDVVYHSHFLEHLDAAQAENFLRETQRVLRPDGLQRIVVPDLETVVRAYLSHLSLSERDPQEAGRHDAYVAAVIEQCVRREAFGSARQKPIQRRMENILLGDARRRGQTHQWLYDKVNLSGRLTGLGFREVRICRYDDSRVPDWARYGLDVNENGGEYKPGSLYVEAIK